MFAAIHATVLTLRKVHALSSVADAVVGFRTYHLRGSSLERLLTAATLFTIEIDDDAQRSIDAIAPLVLAPRLLDNAEMSCIEADPLRI